MSDYSNNDQSRGRRIWNALRDRRDTEPVSFARARIITASYRETEGLPTVIRRAKAFSKIMQEIPIYIDDEQLLVGDFASRPMAAEFFPDLAASWILENFEEATTMWNFGKDITADEIRDICEYWKNKSNKDLYDLHVGEKETAEANEYGEKGSWIFATVTENQTGKGWNIPDFNRAITLGFKGLIAQIDNELEQVRILDTQSLKKHDFLIALKTTLEAGIVFAHRYAKLALELAETAHEKRKEELLQIAEICNHIPENPARTFHEAVQCMHLCHIMAFWDTLFTGLSFGRVDQFLYPYYKRDIETGLIDRNFATEIIECFRVKQSSKRNFFNAVIRKALTGETHMHNCTLGGITTDGKDAVNELSFVWLDAAERTMVPHPTLSIRWHEKLNFDFAMRAIEVCKKGLGFPAWFADTPAIEYLLSQGATLEEARNWAVGGCVLHTIVGKTPSTIPTVINIGKIFEITLNNGRDPLRQGKLIGLQTGELSDFKCYEDFMDAFKKQLKYFINIATNHSNKVRVIRSINYPELFISALFDDCIKKGDSIIGSGGRYQFNAQYALTGGVVDAANSLAALKKCVFEDKTISPDLLMKALSANFEGYEDVHKILLAAPKYGNDDDYVDEIVAETYNFFCNTLKDIDGAFGSKYVESPHSLSWHGSMGNSVGALPSGRKAHTALADGALSPCQGTDKSGPSAVINSAGKVDQVPIFGTLLNMKILPSSLKTPEDSMKLLSLIRTYFSTHKGKHIQFNIVDRETLLDAQKNPQKHRNLVVRVAGYSALFVDCIKAWGGVPAAMTPDEAYDAMSKGALDGIMSGIDSAKSRNYFEVADYIRGPTASSIWMLIINKAVWENLPQDIQQSIQEASNNMSTTGFSEQARIDQEAADFLKTQGMQVKQFTLEEVAIWKKASQPAYDQYIKTCTDAGQGELAQKILAMFLK